LGLAFATARPMTKRPAIPPALWLWLLVLALLPLRLWFAWNHGDAPTFYDEGDYHQIAANLAAGEGFSGSYGPTAFRPPGQPLFLAAVYSLFGTSLRSAYIAQALLASLLPIVTMWFARSELKHSGWAGLAGALSALHPGIAYASTTLYPVLLTSVCLVVGVTYVRRAALRESRWSAPAAGLALGMAGLTTPYLAPLVGLGGVLLALRGRLRRGLIVAVVGLLPVGLWVARNADVLGAPVLGTHGGYNLALGANDRASIFSGNAIEPDLPRADAPDNEVVRDRAYREVALAWIARNPERWLSLAVGRGLATLDSTGRPATGQAPRGAAVWLIGLAVSAGVIAGLAGLVLARRRIAAQLLAAAFILVVISAAATISKPRFRFPCDPLLVVYGLALVRATTARIRRRRRRSDPQNDFGGSPFRENRREPF
jgi:4-amino-4-deoxy-L-arabinose transferase-like glycosyltransferase